MKTFKEKLGGIQKQHIRQLREESLAKAEAISNIERTTDLIEYQGKLLEMGIYKPKLSEALADTNQFSWVSVRYAAVELIDGLVKCQLDLSQVRKITSVVNELFSSKLFSEYAYQVDTFAEFLFTFAVVRYDQFTSGTEPNDVMTKYWESIAPKERFAKGDTVSDEPRANIYADGMLIASSDDITVDFDKQKAYDIAAVGSKFNIPKQVFMGCDFAHPSHTAAFTLQGGTEVFDKIKKEIENHEKLEQLRAGYVGRFPEDPRAYRHISNLRLKDARKYEDKFGTMNENLASEILELEEYVANHMPSYDSLHYSKQVGMKDWVTFATNLLRILGYKFASVYGVTTNEVGEIIRSDTQAPVTPEYLKRTMDRLKTDIQQFEIVCQALDERKVTTDELKPLNDEPDETK